MHAAFYKVLETSLCAHNLISWAHVLNTDKMYSEGNRYSYADLERDPRSITWKKQMQGGLNNMIPSV